MSGRHTLREQFTEQLRLHLDTLYSTALRLTRNQHDAEDLVQDACLRAYRSFGQIEDPARCRGWFLRILTRTFFNAYHQRQRVPETLPYEEEVHQVPGDTPETAVFGRLLDDEISGALEQLPEEFRAAVILADLEGLSYQEIAEALGCPLGTVRSRLSRGRRLLAGLLRVVARERGYLQERRDDEK